MKNDDDGKDQLNIGEEEAKVDLYNENNNISLEKGKEDKYFSNRITVVDNNFDEEENRENSLGLNKIRQTSNSNYNEDINQNVNTINNSNPISQRVTRGANTLSKQLNLIDLKIILLGDSAVGKTSIIGRYVNNSFDDTYNCTIQVETRVKVLNEDENTSIRLNIWDTVGQEKYKALTRQYYHDSDGAFIVFDLTSRESFDNIKNWINDLKSYGSEDTNIIILGNKSDEKNKREISEEEIKNQLNNDYIYLDVSAKTGNNISLAFDKLKKLIMDYLKIKEKKRKEDSINQRKSQKKIINNEIIKAEIPKNETKSNKCC